MMAMISVHSYYFFVKFGVYWHQTAISEFQNITVFYPLFMDSKVEEKDLAIFLSLETFMQVTDVWFL